MTNHLLFFSGTECPHCDAMRPLVAKLAHDTGIILEEHDTWKNQSDYRLFENYQDAVKIKDPECDGLPFFYNTKTGDYCCGELSYRELKSWAVVY